MANSTIILMSVFGYTPNMALIGKTSHLFCHPAYLKPVIHQASQCIIVDHYFGFGEI